MRLIPVADSPNDFAELSALITNNRKNVLKIKGIYILYMNI